MAYMYTSLDHYIPSGVIHDTPEPPGHPAWGEKPAEKNTLRHNMWLSRVKIRDREAPTRFELRVDLGYIKAHLSRGEDRI